MKKTNLDKKLINALIIKYFPEEIRKRKTKIPLWRMVQMIFYRLKTGCQWRELQVRAFCRKKLIVWQSVYYHFNKWSKLGIWKKIWTALLKANKRKIDLSSAQLDGSHTIAKQGGEKVAYQGRKKAKTTNILFFADSKGQILAISEAMEGNQPDIFEIEKSMSKIIQDLQEAEIRVEGLFLNADAAFDSKDFRNFSEQKGIIPNFDRNKRNSKNIDYQYLKDEEVYKERFVVERANAWIDAYKALMIRFEKLKNTWEALLYMAFINIFIKRNF